MRLRLGAACALACSNLGGVPSSFALMLRAWCARGGVVGAGSVSMRSPSPRRRLETEDRFALTTDRLDLELSASDILLQGMWMPWMDSRDERGVSCAPFLPR